MNKLLLLATIFFGIKVFSADINSSGGNYNFKFRDIFGDTTLKNLAPVNPKLGFKDLFVHASVNGLSSMKLNPKAVSFVQGYIENNSERLNRMKLWGKPYFDVISNILALHGLPIELKYLSVIESDLKSSAVSWAGAVGPWQLMPSTARDLGLIVNRKKDERRDYLKSTHAAARYLTELYGLFNDWLLVIAAYNGGPAHVYSAIRKSGSRNFWDLQYYLPAESRTHVKKFIATHYIMEGEGGTTTQTKSENDEDLLKQIPKEIDSTIVLVNISGRYNSIALSQIIQMSLNEFNKLNPSFDQQFSEKGSYDLRLPSDKMNIFQANKSQILEQSLRLLLASAGK